MSIAAAARPEPPGLKTSKIHQESSKDLSVHAFNKNIRARGLRCLGIHESSQSHAILNLIIMQKGPTYRRSTVQFVKNYSHG